MPAASARTTFWSHTGQRSFSASLGPAPPGAGSRCASRHGRQKACRQGRTCRRRAAAPGPPPPADDVDVCEDDDEADELEESGAGEPHISLHSRQIWKSVSGNEAICRRAGGKRACGEEEGARLTQQSASRTRWRRPLGHLGKAGMHRHSAASERPPKSQSPPWNVVPRRRGRGENWSRRVLRVLLFFFLLPPAKRMESPGGRGERTEVAAAAAVPVPARDAGRPAA